MPPRPRAQRRTNAAPLFGATEAPTADGPSSTPTSSSSSQPPPGACSSAEEQRRDCPPLRALVEAMKRADSTPAGRRVWGSPRGGPRFTLSRQNDWQRGADGQPPPPPPDYPAGLLLGRHRMRELGGVLHNTYHFVNVWRDAAAAQAYLQHDGNELLETRFGMQRQTAAGLALAPRRLFAELLQKTGGAAMASTSPPTARITAASAAFACGDTVTKLFVSEYLGTATAEALLCRTLAYAVAVASALSVQGEPAAADAAGGGGDQQEEEEGALGMIDRLSGALLDKVMAQPINEIRLEV